MGGPSEARRKASAWFFIAILLSERAIAIRTGADDTLEELGDSAADGADVSLVSLQARDVQREELNKAYKRGAEAETELTCESAQATMLLVADKAIRDLHPYCGEDACDFSDVNRDEVFVTQEEIIAYAAAADKRHCLPTVMGNTEMQEKLATFLSILPKVFRAPGTQSVGRARLQEAFLQLVAFQQGALALGEGLTDRRLLFDHDVEKSCPAPCQECDHRGAPQFGFRCLLYRKDRDSAEVPSHHAVECSASKSRGWFRRYRYQRHCTVSDWVEAALQHTHVSAMLSCATSGILLGMAGPLVYLTRQDFHRMCVDAEQGNQLSEAENQTLQAQVEITDEAITGHLGLAFGTILAFGLACGLAGLRLRTRDDRDSQDVLTPEGLCAIFAQHLADEGLQLREADVAMYSDSTLFQREEVLRRMKRSQRGFDLKAKNTLQDGTKALTLSTLAMNTQEVVKADDDLNPLPVWAKVIVRITFTIVGAGIMAAGMFAAAGLANWLNVLYFSASTLNGANLFLLSLLYYGLGTIGVLGLFVAVPMAGAFLIARQWRRQPCPETCYDGWRCEPTKSWTCEWCNCYAD